MDPPVAPRRVLLRQAEDERGSSLRDGRSTWPTVWVRPALGDEGPVPAQQRCRLDEEASETLAGKESRQPRQDRSIGRLQHWSVDLASQHRHLVTQHDDFDREVCVTATGEPNQLEDAAERPVEQREGHRRMLAPRESGRQSPDNSRWMAFSAPTRSHRPVELDIARS